MIENFDNWLNESVTFKEGIAFFNKLVGELKKEGNKKFKEVQVGNFGTYTDMEHALDCYDKRGGPQPEDYAKKGSVKDFSVMIHFYPHQLGKVKYEASNFYVFNLETIELIEPLGKVDRGDLDPEDPRHEMLEEFVDTIYDKLLKQYYPLKRTSRKYDL